MNPSRCLRAPARILIKHNWLKSSPARRFCTNVTHEVPLKDVSTPPYLVRVLLVGTSVGLATPIFATAGAFRVWFSYLPKSRWGKLLKYGIGLLIGSGGTTFVYNYFIPFLRDHSEIVLPFALSNLISASGWYTLAEILFGFSALKATSVSPDVILDPKTSTRTLFKSLLFSNRLPAIGAVVGALTVFTSPLLWPYAFHLCFPDPVDRHFLQVDDVSWIVEVYSWIAVPVALPIGILSGLSLHTMLYSSITGSHGTPWQYRSLPLLAVLSTASIGYFVGCRSTTDILYYEERMVPQTGKVVSMNIRTQQILQDNGKSAHIATLKRNFVHTINSIRYFVRDMITSTVNHLPSFLTPSDRNLINNTIDNINTSINKIESIYINKQQNGRNLHLLSTSTTYGNTSNSSTKTVESDTDILDLYSIHNMRDRKALFTLSDRLLRYKYLQTQIEYIRQYLNNNNNNNTSGSSSGSGSYIGTSNKVTSSVTTPAPYIASTPSITTTSNSNTAINNTVKDSTSSNTSTYTIWSTMASYIPTQVISSLFDTTTTTSVPTSGTEIMSSISSSSSSTSSTAVIGGISNATNASVTRSMLIDATVEDTLLDASITKNMILKDKLVQYERELQEWYVQFQYTYSRSLTVTEINLLLQCIDQTIVELNLSVRPMVKKSSLFGSFFSSSTPTNLTEWINCQKKKSSKQGYFYGSYDSESLEDMELFKLIYSCMMLESNIDYYNVEVSKLLLK